MDTRGVYADEFEGLALQVREMGVGGDAVAALEGNAHGVAGQGTEMSDQLGEAHDRQALVGAPDGALDLRSR